MLITSHRVSAESFARLSAGPVDVATMRELRRGQLSKHKLLVRAVQDAARRYPREARAARLEHAVELLDEVERAAPAVAADVLGYPLVGAWAAHCLQRLRAGPERRHSLDAAGDGDAAARDGTARGAPLWVELAHLASVAGAAAIRAGVRAHLDVPAHRGWVSLPTLGRLRLNAPVTWGVATLSGTRGSYTLRGAVGGEVSVPTAGDGSADGWEAVRTLRFGDGSRTLTVRLDDVDPYRDHYGLRATGRLGDSAVADWRELLRLAWARLGRYHAEWQVELTGHPLAVVPLVDPGPDRGVNVTARDSVGAMGLTPPPSEALLAQHLVHEHQHSKLGSLLDLVDLVDVEDHRRFYSPWRADPRPVSGLLQAAYAFYAVTDFWRPYVGGKDPAVSSSWAQYELARGRRQVAEVLGTVLRSGALTPAGRRFAIGLRRRVRDWWDVAVASGSDHLAELAADDHRLRWRLCNLPLADDVLVDLVYRWRHALPALALPEPDQVPAARAAVAPAEPMRPRLLRHAAAGEELPEAPVAERLLLRGRYSDATRSFVAGLLANPDDVEHWVGLALARLRSDRRATLPVWRRPELVRALHTRLRVTGETAPHPDRLAAWLSEVTA